MRRQADDALERIDAVGATMAGWRERIADAQSSTPSRALELFMENPYWTVSGLAERLGAAYTTAQRAVERLELEGIVTQVGDTRRNRVYCARELLTILDAPLHLVDEESESTRGR